MATSLPDRLASVRDALLLKHPSKLTIEVLESAFKDVKSNLHSVASASGVVPPPLFHRCTVPQLLTFTASLATAANDVTAAAVTTSSRSRGRSGRRGGQGAGGGRGGGGSDVASGGGGSAGARGAPRATAGDSPAATGGVAAAAPPLAAATLATEAAAGARRSQPCGRSHPPGQCFAQLTDMARLAYCVDGPAPDWLPLVQTYGPALWGMSASQLVDLFGTPRAIYAVVDSSASDSIYSSVVSFGASLVEVHVASVGTCVDTSPGAAPEDALLPSLRPRGPYAVRYAAHQLNLWPRVSRPEVSSTSLWTGSPGAASRFCVSGCLALVRDTSADKISPHAVSCVFLGFPGDSSDYTFYHPPLHRFFDSRDVRFDESVPYYARYPCRGVSHATPPPSVAPQVQPPSPQSSSQPTADPAGAGFRGEDPGGASSRGAGVGAESVPVRGPGSGAVPGGATNGGAPFAGPGELGTDPVTYGDSAPGPCSPCPWEAAAIGVRGERVGTAAAGATAAGGAAPAAAAAAAAAATPRAGVAAPAAAPAAAAAAAAAATSSSCLWSSDPRSPLSFSSLPPLSSYLCHFPYPLRPSVSPLLLLPPPPLLLSLVLRFLLLTPPPLLPLSPPLSHTWPSCRSPRARPSSPIPFTDLRTALFCSSPPHLSPSVLPSPPESALTASLSTPATDYYRTYCPVLSRVLASLVTDPRASLSFVSALTAPVTEFASTRCLDYATSLVAAPPTSPLAIGGESALGCDALEDRQFELEFLATASPHLCAMLLAPEGDPGALDIPTPRTC
ncbi:unnamed protein product [Closterium sp. NIES-53]